jgi:hypothetical protein
MRSIFHPSLRSAARVVLVPLLAGVLGGCALFQSDEPAPTAKKSWSLWPWGGSQGGGDATPYIEYQRTRSQGAEPTYTLIARNTHMKKTIVGQMRTTMQTSPGDLKVDSQSFTLAPNEPKQLLIYPVRFPLTYEVSATFRD